MNTTEKTKEPSWDEYNERRDAFFKQMGFDIKKPSITYYKWAEYTYPEDVGNVMTVYYGMADLLAKNAELLMAEGFVNPKVYVNFTFFAILCHARHQQNLKYGLDVNCMPCLDEDDMDAFVIHDEFLMYNTPEQLKVEVKKRIKVVDKRLKNLFGLVRISE